MGDKILHVLESSNWLSSVSGGRYTPPGLQTDGFVHCCTVDQLEFVVTNHFEGAGDLWALELDPVALGDALRWEPSEGPGAFPHVYGPVPLSAVVAAAPVPRPEARFSVEAVGRVVNDAPDAVDESWGDVVSRIHLAPALAPGLTGLEGFSHALVVFRFHKAGFDPGADLVRRPRRLADFPLSGIFAQRARSRPNGIGITAVRVLDVSGGVLTVRGLDAVDGTPVLDVKPYFPVFDSRPDATTPAWVARLMQGYF